ncbi:unnamed protein product [Meloidogyne enterolobii]|uniref:Uncharacterized protein n=1 Tax=Meloidogyne enterolobii TaxID=390850 RepID=A0ACB1B3R3_MELEN
MDENVWDHSNNNNVFGSGTSTTQRPNDPRSTVLRSISANSTTPPISANDSVTLGGSGATSLPLAAQSIVAADNTVVANLVDNSTFLQVIQVHNYLLVSCNYFFMKIGNNKAIKSKGVTNILDYIYIKIWIQRFWRF